MKRLLVVGIILTFATSAFAGDIGLKGIGGRLGYVMPEDPIDATFGFGVQADLGQFTPDIKFAAFIDYWSKGYDEAYYEWSWTTIAFGATAKYEVAMEGNIVPYFGGGVGLNYGKWSGEYKGPASPYITETDQDESEIDFDFHFLGGGKMPLSPTMDGILELKYVISGNADYFGIWGGVVFKLGGE